MCVLYEGATYDMTRRLDKEAIKVRILSLLKGRPLLFRMRDKGVLKQTGFKRGSQYVLPG